jgi:hypothetical protein
VEVGASVNPGEVAGWFDGEVWHRVRVLIPFGGGARAGVPWIGAAFLRLDDQTRIVVGVDGSVREGLPA